MTTEHQPEKSLEVLSDDECLRLLGEAVIGRVGFQADDVLHILPVNYAVDADGTVVFRTTVDGLLSRHRRSTGGLRSRWVRPDEPHRLERVRAGHGPRRSSPAGSGRRSTCST